MKQWSDDMGEISGFGGRYEAICRAMVLAAIEWIDLHPEAVIQAHSYKNIYGIVIADSDDCKAMEEAMMNAPVYHDGKLLQQHVKDNCTLAMHHAAMDHALVYKRLGWEKYCQILREANKDDPRTN